MSGLKIFTKINQKINEDLYSTKDSKEKQVALILKLIMECHFRVGNERYSKKYKSYGTTTLENKHVKVKKDHVIIDSICFLCNKYHFFYLENYMRE